MFHTYNARMRRFISSDLNTGSTTAVRTALRIMFYDMYRKHENRSEKEAASTVKGPPSRFGDELLRRVWSGMDRCHPLVMIRRNGGGRVPTCTMCERCAR